MRTPTTRSQAYFPHFGYLLQYKRLHRGTRLSQSQLQLTLTDFAPVPSDAFQELSGLPVIGKFDLQKGIHVEKRFQKASSPEPENAEPEGGGNPESMNLKMQSQKGSNPGPIQG